MRHFLKYDTYSLCYLQNLPIFKGLNNNFVISRISGLLLSAEWKLKKKVPTILRRILGTFLRMIKRLYSARAIASISMMAPFGNCATWTAERAGGLFGK